MKLKFSTLYAAALLSFSAGAANEDTVERGRYLATAGNCSSCHTVPGAPPYTGGVPFATDFGTLYSTNITQDKNHGIGEWTEAQFQTALKHGIRPDGEYLYPAFPYTAYSKLSAADIAALYAYFQTLPAATTPSPANELSFPYSQRRLMQVWNWLYHKPGELKPREEKSPAWNRGAYLVEALGHCSACHTPRNWLGAERKELAYSGGEYLDTIPNGQRRPWFAIDLSDSHQGLGAWSVEQVEQYLKKGINDYATSFGPMNKVIERSTRHLTSEDIHAMAVYLKDIPAINPEDTEPEVPAQITSKGATLYAIHCATCHLPTGKGSLDTGPSMIGNPVVQASNPASLINVILYGPELPEFSLNVQRSQMDGYQNLLTDSEIAALSNYMRNTWGNVAGVVTEEQVARQR